MLRCGALVPVVPANAQLARVTPFRVNGDELLEGPNQCDGVSVSPSSGNIADEFIVEAVKKGHPKNFQAFLPDVIVSAMKKKFGDQSQSMLVDKRATWFRKRLHDVPRHM